MPATTTRQLIEDIVKANKASQDPEELKELLGLIIRSEIKTVLEIGTHLGYSGANWYRAFEDAKIIGIEKEIPKFHDNQWWDNLIFNDSHDEETLETVKDFLLDIENNVIRSVDLLFIDGDHRYEAVKKDYEMYSPLVQAGGFIVFHDVILKDHPEVEVYKFWEEVKQNYDEFVTIHHGVGTGYGVLFVK